MGREISNLKIEVNRLRLTNEKNRQEIDGLQYDIKGKQEMIDKQDNHIEQLEKKLQMHEYDESHMRTMGDRFNDLLTTANRIRSEGNIEGFKELRIEAIGIARAVFLSIRPGYNTNLTDFASKLRNDY